jgi:hypothetical protein
MRLCILCESSYIDDVRSVGKVIGDKILHIPVSETGKLPATHWFCCLTTNSYQKILDLKNHTIMEESGPKEFLMKYNLKVIR